MLSFHRLIFFANLFSTLIMVAVIWWVQVYRYPSFASIPKEQFILFHGQYSRMISFVVILPMTIELFTAGILIFHHPQEMPSIYPVIGLLLVAILWISTFFFQVPMHEILGNGFDAEAHRKLVSSNWIRTITWTLRSGFLFYLYSKFYK